MMKKHFQYSDGEIVLADAKELPTLLQQNQAYLQNYLEVADSLDDESYIARGNGFCEAKYSEDFIDSQIRKYRSRIADIERWMSVAK